MHEILKDPLVALSIEATESNKQALPEVEPATPAWSVQTHVLPNLNSSLFARLGSRLSLRGKAISLVVLALLILLPLFAIPVRTILLDSFARLEKAQMATDLARAENALNNQLDALGNSVRDYAFSDAMYAFSANHTPAMVQPSVTIAAINNLRLNALAIYDPEGKLLYGMGFDYDQNQQEQLPSYFSDPTFATNPILIHQVLPNTNKGIISLPAGPMLVASLPILSSTQAGPQGGSLVVGRYISTNMMADLANITQLSLSLDPLPAAQGNDAFDPLFAGVDSVVHAGGNTVVGSSLLRTFEGQPVLVLSVTSPRTVFDQGVRIVYYMAASVLVIVLAFAVMFGVLLERMMVSRMMRLSTRVAEIGAMNDPSARIKVDGTDEIARLGASINRTLDTLERSGRRRTETEASYRTVVEHAAESIFVIDPDTGFFLESNAAFRDLLGYTKEDMARLTIYDIVAMEGALVDKYIRKILADMRPQVAERHYLGKDGNTVRVEEYASTLRRDGRKVLCFLASELVGVIPHIDEKSDRQSEERFRAMVQNAADVITIVNPNGTIRYQSPSIERMLGFNTSRLIGMSIFDNLHDDDVDQMQHMVAEVIERPGVAKRATLRIQHADHSWRFVEIIATNHLRDSNVGGIILNMRDVTERKVLEEQLMHQAFHDPLTGLPNRTYFLERLTSALRKTARPDSVLAVMFVDLDNFKVINDSLGHHAGDLLLAEAARTIREAVRPLDIVARFGGDEFTLLLQDLDSTEAALVIAERVQRALQVPRIIENHEISVACSVGVAFSDPAVLDPEELIRNADIAVYKAKADGKARITLFDREMNRYALHRLETEIELRRAIERNELVLYYQPLLDLMTGAVLEMEALVRWQHPKRGLVSPLEFIPLAEETSLIIPLGKWVLEEACMQAQAWKSLGHGAAGLVVCVNVSARQFRQNGLLEDIAHALEISGLPPGDLKLEITETVGMEDPEQSLATLRALKALGVKLALDDFGMGYSSLSYLKHFPMDSIKLDRSFISGLGNNRQDTAVVYAAVSFAKALHLTITAEGIESNSQVEQLRALGCELGQGYLFSKPLPAWEMAEYLVTHDPSVQTLPLANAVRTML
ncbi:MAG TPA: EAL domain-containing protein [Chloroflexia bacterium]|nr:EAL domain-containing protein [Chloroflexia bacterium]